MKELAYFDESLVLTQVSARDKWEVISLLVDAASSSPPLVAQRDTISPALLLNGVKERESERSTGLGNGIAFPHARVPGLNGAVLCLAFLDPPIDFEAIDGQPAYMALLILVPEDQPQTALQLMSQFARLLSDPVEHEALMGMHSASGIHGFISRRILEKDVSVTARDIMREVLATVRPHTPIKEVTRLMNQHLLDTVAVVDDDGTLVGEVTCDALFKLGMPHFFTQLKSIAFIREFDPFEKYFAGESDTLARDVMTDDFAAVPESATLLEIVFELAVHRRPKVYVARDNEMRGVIDRILVLDRVINV